MDNLVREFENLFNPALGSVILQKFAEGYSQRENKGTPLTLFYVIFPVLFQEQVFTLLSKTQSGSGLRKFLNKLYTKENSLSDIALSFPKRTEEFRNLTERSLRMGLLTNLLVMQPKGGIVFHNRKKKFKPASSDVEELLKGAKKLGGWCASLSLFEIGNLLGLEL